jgi:hypothetical protein
MPFRKLPVTDNAMLRAMLNLITAYDVYVTNEPDIAKRIQAFSAETYARLLELKPLFEKEMVERSGALSVQSEATQVKNHAMRKLKKCVDHFFIVMNLAIDRQVLDPSIRAMYGLDLNQKSIPLIYSREDTSYWAQKIITAETRRIADGGLPVQFPSLAEVQAAYNDFDVKLNAHLIWKNNYDLQQEDVEHLRKGVKTVIREGWDEVEFYFRKNKLSSLRRKARLWGVEYGTRKGEKPEENNEQGI